MDSEKTGKLNEEKFVDRFGTLLTQPQQENTGGPGGRGPARFIGPGLFNAADADKDHTLTRDEFKQTFAKWFDEWDKDKSGALDAAKLRDGFNNALPRPQFGGPGGPGGRGPGRGRGGMEKPSEQYQFTVVCLDRATGKVAWQQIAREEVPHEGFHQEEGSFASPSGLTDGKHYFAYFGSRGLYSYDFNGKQVWNRDLGKMRIAMGFGEGSSLALHKDTLVLKWDNEDGSWIAAIDKNTGKTLWKEDRDEGTSWSSPLILEHKGRTEVVTAATRKIRSYDLVTGKLLWECGGLTRNVIPTPVADDERVYCMSGFNGNSLLAIKLGGSGDLSNSDSIAWSYKKSTSYVPSALLCDGKLYFLAGNNAVLSCLDAKTGKVLIDAERLEGLQGSYVSPLAAGGHIYIASRNGSTVVLKQSDKVEILATNHLEDRFDASPVAVGKDLILRGRENLYLISEK
jgi:FOG: WD40-like repeat